MSRREMTGWTPHVLENVLPDELDRQIVTQLALGLTDEAIARRLGISHRTCARRVASILRETGAASRFQAGVLLSSMLPGATDVA